MKSKITDRPMFRKDIEEDEVENVGIMQGFMDEMDAEDEMENDEDYQTEKMLDRSPNSPEILMNNLRGDMRSIDARVEELADLVGYNAAAETPEGVLALLQPVLAAQQAPAMPPQGAAPQGMPPMPPQGMPPEAAMGGMPPEMMAGMPPEAAMGGIGALPTDQGPAPDMGAPVMMAAGGPVQYFNEGSDEDGVTPAGDTSSFAGVFSPEIIQAAREQVLASLKRAPLPTPDLASEIEKRTPLYEKLLGVDPKQSQAQILFELGQRAFNYGANVDDQGRPLYGSQAARLAGAVRTLPGAMGQITNQMDQQRRAVRSAALQATEKDIQNVRESNAKLIASQTKGWQEIAKSANKGMSFGAGTEGVAWSTLAKLAPDYGAGTLPENQARMFETSLAIVSKPVQYTDEYNRIKLREPVIPDYIKRAVKDRNDLLAGITPNVRPPALDTTIPTEATMPERSAVAVAAPGSDARAKQEDIARRFNTAKAQFEAGVMPQAEYDTLVATLNEESKQLKAVVEETKPVKSETAPAKSMSLWDVAKDFTGPSASVRAGVTSVPSLGGTSPEVTRARSYASSAINQIVAALGTTARFGNTERQQIKDELGLNPAVLQDPMKFRERLVGLEALLTEEIANAKRIIDDDTVPVALKKEAESSLAELTNAKKFISIPRVTSKEQARAYEVGDAVLFTGTYEGKQYKDKVLFIKPSDKKR